MRGLAVGDPPEEQAGEAGTVAWAAPRAKAIPMVRRKRRTRWPNGVPARADPLGRRGVGVGHGGMPSGMAMRLKVCRMGPDLRGYAAGERDPGRPVPDPDDGSGGCSPGEISQRIRLTCTDVGHVRVVDHFRYGSYGPDRWRSLARAFSSVTAIRRFPATSPVECGVVVMAAGRGTVMRGVEALPPSRHGSAVLWPRREPPPAASSPHRRD